VRNTRETTILNPSERQRENMQPYVERARRERWYIWATEY